MAEGMGYYITADERRDLLMIAINFLRDFANEPNNQHKKSIEEVVVNLSILLSMDYGVTMYKRVEMDLPAAVMHYFEVQKENPDFFKQNIIKAIINFLRLDEAHQHYTHDTKRKLVVDARIILETLYPPKTNIIITELDPNEAEQLMNEPKFAEQLETITSLPDLTQQIADIIHNICKNDSSQFHLYKQCLILFGLLTENVPVDLQEQASTSGQVNAASIFQKMFGPDYEDYDSD